jgi:hypothetical protein
MLRRSFIQSLKRIEDTLCTVGLRSLSCSPSQEARNELLLNAPPVSSVDSTGMKIDCDMILIRRIII